MLPLREPSGLGAPPMRALVLRRSEGTIGEMTALLSAAADMALGSGGECIAPETIKAADYQPPSVRRRMFERALR